MSKHRANSREASITWAVRRAVYLVGAAIGVALVASGRVTQEQVDGWLPLVAELGGVLTTLGFAFAAWRTGPDSDNSRPVIDAQELESLFDLLERMIGKADGTPNPPVTPPLADPEPGDGPVGGEPDPDPSPGESGSLLDELYFRIHGTPRPR